MRESVGLVSAEPKQLGEVYPPPAVRWHLPDKDAREYALERLREFICALVFRRTGGENEEPIGFVLTPAAVQVYQPDDPKDALLPSIAFVPGVGVSEPFGLGPAQFADEELAPDGTAIVRLGTYTEPFIISVLSAKHAVRRAIVAGLQTVLRLDETSYSLKLSLPKYFGQVAQFTLGNTQYLEDSSTALNRRRAFIHVELSVSEVGIVNAVPFEPSAETVMFEPTEEFDVPVAELD